MFSKFALEYAIRSVHANQENLILKGTHQLVVNVNVLGGSVHTLHKEKQRLLVVASKETCLELNAEKFQYTWLLLEIRMRENNAT
jgi:hypothetical protein